MTGTLDCMTFEYKAVHPRTGADWLRFFKESQRAEARRKEAPIVAELRATVDDEAGRNGEAIADLE